MFSEIEARDLSRDGLNRAPRSWRIPRSAASLTYGANQESAGVSIKGGLSVEVVEANSEDASSGNSISKASIIIFRASTLFTIWDGRNEPSA